MNSYETDIKKEKNGTYKKCAYNIVLFLENDEKLFDNDKYRFSVVGNNLYFDGEQINPIIRDDIKEMIIDRYGYSKVSDKEIKEAFALITNKLIKQEKEKRKNKKDDFIDKLVSVEIKNDGYIRDDKGQITNCIDNFQHFFETDEKYAGKLKYNVFKLQKEFDGELWNDFMISNSYNDCARKTSLWNSQKVDSVLMEIFSKNSYNPVQEYLNGLVWDGKKRIPTFFVDTLEANDSELVREMTKLWFIGACKRVLIPGCKFDYMIVLQGIQGIGKSKLCGLLSRGYYSTLLLDELKNKDCFDKLSKSWIVLIDEMDDMKAKDMSKIKSFISAEKNEFRKPYGRETQDVLRHCIFVGSINGNEILKDSTSLVERRFWIIECNKTTLDDKIQKIMTDEYVDQLWAEAMYYYNENPDRQLYIQGDLQEVFANEMSKFNVQTKDDYFDYFEMLMDRKYSLDNNGCFSSAVDFERQYNEINTYTNNLQYVNKIPVAWVSIVMKKVFGVEKRRQYIIKGLNGKWEYKPAIYNGKTTKCWVRVNPIEEDKVIEKEDDCLPF